jgi:transcriptional regulator with XRE-family HTH domain
MPIMDRLSLKVFGERLRQRRKDQQMSQQELAKLMQIPQSWISELENGKRPHVEADTVYRFCRALGCTSDYLVGLIDDPTPAKKRPRSRKAAPVG